MVTNLRVHHGPLVANIVENHHEGALHAACGRSRVPGVMTTTLRVNAQELQVSTTVKENARDTPACGNRVASSSQTIATALEKHKFALQKSRIGRTPPLNQPRSALRRAATQYSLNRKGVWARISCGIGNRPGRVAIDVLLDGPSLFFLDRKTKNLHLRGQN